MEQMLWPDIRGAPLGRAVHCKVHQQHLLLAAGQHALQQRARERSAAACVARVHASALAFRQHPAPCSRPGWYAEAVKLKQ